MRKWLAATAILSIATVCNSIGWDSFPCESLPTNLGNRTFYVNVCEGQRLLTQGDFRTAAKRFETAAALPIHEEPNFEVLLDVARARCAAGDRTKGKAAISEFDDSLKIYSGMKACSGTSKEKPSQAQRRMCTEVLAPTYLKTGSTPQQRRHVATLGVLRDQTNAACETKSGIR